MNFKISIKHITFILLLIFFSIFSYLVYTTGTALPDDLSPISENAIQGKLLWQKYNCIACHQIYGLGGYLGPDLTNIISSKTKGESYIRAVLKTGPLAMPNYHLSEKEIDSFVEYLKYIDKTGRFPEKNVDWTWYGSFGIMTSKKMPQRH